MKKSLIVFVLTPFLFACSNKKSSDSEIKQPYLGYRSAKILNVDGFEFKDLNRNNQLDKYEDWRLANDVRSQDQVSKMSLEQKAGFMIIGRAFEKPQSTDPIASGFNETDLVRTENMFIKKFIPC